MIFEPVSEEARTYDFGDYEVTIYGVIGISIRPSGWHCLKTGDGHIHTIPVGWYRIESRPALKRENSVVKESSPLVIKEARLHGSSTGLI